MKLLALETATEACSAAVWVDGAVLERYEIAPRRHAVLILPMVEAVLAEAGLTMNQLDAIAVGRGPGAFTGVRIAIGIAQGLAFAGDLPVVPVSTLAALALGAAREMGQTRIATALDARMGEIYWGTWAVSDDGVALLGEERVCAPASGDCATRRMVRCRQRLERVCRSLVATADRERLAGRTLSPCQRYCSIGGGSGPA